MVGDLVQPIHVRPRALCHGLQHGLLRFLGALKLAVDLDREGCCGNKVVAMDTRA